MITNAVANRQGQTRDPAFALTPCQQGALDALLKIAIAVPITVLRGGLGSGKTAVLAAFQREVGGTLLNVGDFLEAMDGAHPYAYDTIIRRVIEDALCQADIVVIDDLDVLEFPNGTAVQARRNLLGALEGVLIDAARASGKHIVASRFGDIRAAKLMTQAVEVSIDDPSEGDFAAFFSHYLPVDAVRRLDIDQIFQRARHLDGHALRNLCLLMRDEPPADFTTDGFIERMEMYSFHSNLREDEVEDIEFSSLKGAEHIIEQLEAFILNPMLEPKLAQSLNLRPRRGVLLHGAPGTGKTSIGRVLARKMKGRFFRIDGNFVDQPPAQFFANIDRIFQQATINSPSVIFIDDADILFKATSIIGLNRYLLTKLDGLAGEDSGSVCVMMTAMDVADIPQAILRSGRLDVWLETKLPDERTRAEIIEHFSRTLPPEHRHLDVAALARETDGFTPADLRRIVGDARSLLAYDKVHHATVQAFGNYVGKAIEELREVRDLVAAATGTRTAPTLWQSLGRG